MAMDRRPAVVLGSFTSDLPFIVTVRLCSIRRIPLPRSTSFRRKPEKFGSTKLRPCCKGDDEAKVLGHRIVKRLDLADGGHGPFCRPLNSCAVYFARRGDEEAIGHCCPHDRGEESIRLRSG